jgi:predicted nuclease with TOPRIM domain
MSTKEFKSPVYKLIAFFEKSRDNWKAKYLETKYTVKKLQRRMRYLTVRKRELKERVKHLECELSMLRARDQKRTEELETLKKRHFEGTATLFLP